MMINRQIEVSNRLIRIHTLRFPRPKKINWLTIWIAYGYHMNTLGMLWFVLGWLLAFGCFWCFDVKDTARQNVINRPCLAFNHWFVLARYWSFSRPDGGGQLENKWYEYLRRGERKPEMSCFSRLCWRPLYLQSLEQYTSPSISLIH